MSNALKNLLKFREILVEQIAVSYSPLFLAWSYEIFLLFLAFLSPQLTSILCSRTKKREKKKKEIKKKTDLFSKSFLFFFLFLFFPSAFLLVFPLHTNVPLTSLFSPSTVLLARALPFHPFLIFTYTREHTHTHPTT